MFIAISSYSQETDIQAQGLTVCVRVDARVDVLEIPKLWTSHVHLTLVLVMFLQISFDISLY